MKNLPYLHPLMCGDIFGLFNDEFHRISQFRIDILLLKLDHKMTFRIGTDPLIWMFQAHPGIFDTSIFIIENRSIHVKAKRNGLGLNAILAGFE